MPVTVEQLLDKIADELILDESGVINPNVVKDNQKTIRNGTIQLGRGENDRLVLYQKDVEANKKDLLFTSTVDGEEIPKLEQLALIISDIDNVTISILNAGTSDNPVYTIALESIIDGIDGDAGNIDFIVDSNTNPLNVSQFVSIKNESSIINVDKANEFLDTSIYELLPIGDTRQDRITRFFNELGALLPNTVPDFNNPVDRLPNGTWTGNEQYSQDNSITYNEDEGYIHRIKNLPTGNINESKTIEDIYRTVEPYLKDILEEPILPQDGRPEYENKSSGYLQFRNLNQGIIIRNTNSEFVEGLNPVTQEYLDTGFTITMWVRFLDKVSEGTLSNFGNPTRTDNPFGFKLETYVVDKNSMYQNAQGTDVDTFEKYVLDNNVLTKDTNEPFFTNTNTERFVQLVVRDKPLDDGEVGILRDSHTGMSWAGGYDRQINIPEGENPSIGKLTTTRIPVDFQEWYFICATFNQNTIEPEATGDYSQEYSDNKRNSDFWINHVIPGSEPQIVPFSGYGAKCKVEIISRSNLLRARGFKID